MTNELELAASLLKDLPPKVYDDVFQPTAQLIGKSLHDTVYIILAPHRALVWGYKQVENFICEKVAEKLKKVPPEELVSPSLNVAGPLIEALKYTEGEPLLSDLYANLLAASMQKSLKSGAHPAFVEIIKQMTPDEAKLIRLFAIPNRSFPLLGVRYEFINPTTEKNGGGEVNSVFSIFANNIGLENLDQMPVYINNLIRLQLINVPEFLEYTTPGVYEATENAPEMKKIKEDIESNPDLICRFQRKTIKITDLGKQFIKICVSQEV